MKKINLLIQWMLLTSMQHRTRLKIEIIILSNEIVQKLKFSETKRWNHIILLSWNKVNKIMNWNHNCKWHPLAILMANINILQHLSSEWIKVIIQNMQTIRTQ